LVTALFRLTELSGGRILIDNVDISSIGLRDLRTHIAIIPQEVKWHGSSFKHQVDNWSQQPQLFSGTVRSNLDPFGYHDDSRLWDALHRSHLTSKGGENRIGLETAVEPDGANLSVGERSLLSLARALVKDSQIVVLDEATYVLVSYFIVPYSVADWNRSASVDFETDSRIQNTIQAEFGDRTLLCIAREYPASLSFNA